MVRSMTGFGRSEVIDEEKKILVEIKAVNHRYCDLNIKMGKRLAALENNVRNVLKTFIIRGKVDVYIYYENYKDSNVNVKYNSAIAGEYVKYLKEIVEEYGVRDDISACSVARFSEVFSLEEDLSDEDEIWNDLKDVICQAAENFNKARAVEGEHLKEDLIAKLESMIPLVETVEKESPKVVEDYKAKLTEKIGSLIEKGTVDENRLAAEVTIYADKVCVDEEIVRLKSHIKKAIDILNRGGEAGKELDFIAQEMNREANTTLSKAACLDIADVGIQLKTLIEKIREQIQNIE